MGFPKIIERELFVDDRGMVYGAFDNMDEAGIKRTYVIENHAVGTIRAWHYHYGGDTYLHVISGAAKLAAVSAKDKSKCVTVTLSEKNPSLFYVPRGWANGSMSLVPNTKILVYSTLTLEECKMDDERWSCDSVLPGIWGVKNR